MSSVVELRKAVRSFRKPTTKMSKVDLVRELEHHHMLAGRDMDQARSSVETAVKEVKKEMKKESVTPEDKKAHAKEKKVLDKAVKEVKREVKEANKHIVAGEKIAKKKFEKGSEEAKEHMRRIREMRKSKE